MKNKLIILIFAMIMLVGMVNATTNDAIGYYSFDDADYSAPTVIDISGTGNNGTNTGGATTGATGKINEAFNFDGSNDYISLETGLSPEDNDFTYNFWFNTTSTTADIRNILGGQGNAAADWFRIYLNTDHTLWLQMDDGTNPIISQQIDATTQNDGNWHFITIRRKASENRVEVFRDDGELLLNNTDIDTGLTFDQSFYIGDAQVSPSPFDGIIDEVSIYDRALTATEISELYNSGTGLNPYTPVVFDTLNISSLVYPLNNTQYSTSIINFNTTINATYNFNCSLYIGDVLNQTRDGFASGSDVPVSFNATLGNALWNYTISCFDNTTTENTTINYFYIDTIFPAIQDNFTNGTLFANNPLNIRFNFTDDFSLFSYNISIDGVKVNSSSGILDTFLQINWTYPTTGLTPGTHTLNITTADGHTAKSLKGDYKVKNGLFNNYLEFEMYDKNDWVIIKDKEQTLFDSWTAEKKKDRYSFKYKPNKLKNKYTFTVTAGKPIYIMDKEDTPWNKWIIIGDHWLDLYPYTDVEISKVKNNEVEITISNVDSSLEELEFNSIGDLNIISKIYTFYTTNTTVGYTTPVISLSSQTITFDIEKNTGATATQAALVWNGTYKTVTKLTYPTYDRYTSTFITPNFAPTEANISFTWNFNVTGLVNNISSSVTTNQTVDKILIDNCSTYTTRAFNFTVRNETSNALVSATTAGYFELWNTARGSFTSFNLTWTGVNKGSICISPSTANYSVYSQIEYSATGFNSKTYYLTDTRLNNITQTATFYLTSGTTAVTFNVKDQDDVAVEDVYINILKYDLATNSYVTSEIIKTDQEGSAIGNVVLTTQWYKFLLMYNNVAVLETEPVKLTTVTRNFRINLLDDFITGYNANKNVTRSLTFTNSTGNFIYTFVNPTGTDVTACLSVYQRVVLGDIPINETCLTSPSGTILINIGSDRSGIYVATGTVSASPAVFDALIVDYAEAYKQWGQSGVFAAFLVRVTLLMIGAWNPIIGIVMLMLADILMIMFGLMKLSWDVMIIYLILGGWAIIKLRNKD